MRITTAEQKWAACLLALLLAVWSSGFYFYFYRQSSLVEWRPAKARVLHSSVRSADSQYFPLVFFEYLVDGRRYVGDAAALELEPRGTEEGARRLIDRFPAGRDFVIFHSPSKPEVAAPRRKFVRTTDQQIIASGLLILGSLLGLTICVQLTKKVQRRRDSGVTRVLIDEGTADGQPVGWSGTLLDPPNGTGSSSGDKSGKSARGSGVHT